MTADFLTLGIKHKRSYARATSSCIYDDSRLPHPRYQAQTLVRSGYVVVERNTAICWVILILSVDGADSQHDRRRISRT